MTGTPAKKIFTTQYRVTYEDTDAGGVVYYGNYLRFFERGRTELIRDAGFTVRELAESGLFFPVVSVKVGYRNPAFYDDLLCIETEVLSIGRTSVTFSNRIFRAGDDTLLVEGEVTIVCVDGKLKPKRMPGEIRNALGALR
ncbi:MAG: acyl-CoA thioesterase [bacterium]